MRQISYYYHTTPFEDILKELQKRNAQLEEENIILKKALAIMTPRSGKE